MKFTIESEAPSIEIEIEMHHNGFRTTAILGNSGGNWHLVGFPSPWIGKASLPWPEALKRSLERLDKQMREVAS